jgi:hypothetical protein
MRGLCLQVLPVSEESRSDVTDELVKLEDVRVEVMRSRGAGGQVRLSNISPPLCKEPIRACLAREQNRICSTPNSCTHWDHRVNAGRTKSTSGTFCIEVDKFALHHPTRRIKDELFKFCGRDCWTLN